MMMPILLLGKLKSREGIENQSYPWTELEHIHSASYLTLSSRLHTESPLVSYPAPLPFVLFLLFLPIF